MRGSVRAGEGAGAFGGAGGDRFRHAHGGGKLGVVAWRADEAYRSGLNFFDPIVERVPTDAWSQASPCAGWRALDVLGHVGKATAYGIALLAGNQPDWQPDDTPGDAVQGDPAAWWRTLSSKIRTVAAEIDLSAEVDTPAGRRSIADGLAFPAVDLFVHGWDLARCARHDVEICSEAIAFAHTLLDGMPDATLRSRAVFAPAQATPEGASPTEAFIGWTGRDPKWSLPG